MKFKIDEETGFIEVQDGKPVISRDDGSTSAMTMVMRDAKISQYNPISRLLSGVSMSHPLP